MHGKSRNLNAVSNAWLLTSSRGNPRRGPIIAILLLMFNQAFNERLNRPKKYPAEVELLLQSPCLIPLNTKDFTRLV